MKKYFASHLSLSAVVLLLVSSASAQEKPSAETARDFLNFYFYGQGKGVVLADMMPCIDVVDHECIEPVDTSMLMTNSAYKIWMAFVVPDGDTVESLKVHFIKDGVIKATRDMSVRSSIRYRTYRTFSPEEAGAWEIRVVDERGVAIETVGSLQVVVGS